MRARFLTPTRHHSFDSSRDDARQQANSALHVGRRYGMGKVESLQEQVQTLSREEFAQFRAWLLDRDWADWDAQLEGDVEAGRLDALAEQALRDHASGKTTPL